MSSLILLYLMTNWPYFEYKTIFLDSLTLSDDKRIADSLPENIVGL